MTSQTKPETEPAANDHAEVTPERARRNAMNWRRPVTTLSRDSIQRQGHVTHLAFNLLGREPALVFLNSHDSGLGARPLDLAAASKEGCVAVQDEVERMAALRSGSGSATVAGARA
jgi:hypothetical protein